MTRALRLVRIDEADGATVDGEGDEAPPTEGLRLLVPATRPTAAHLAWCEAVERAFDDIAALAEDA